MLKREWILVAVVFLLSAGVIQQIAFTASPVKAQVASKACVACLDRCVQIRESCRSQACARAGGKDRNAGACDGGNAQVYSDGARACGNQEVACKNQCQSTAACK